jgi:hypothetical protein
MLPGFRFLLAAIVLSISMLIFGLGAAALLRAAHEEFASIPSRRAPPEVMFPQRDDAGPTLAMLRVEPSVVDEKAVEPPMADHEQDQPAIVLAPTVEKPATEPDKIAALTDTAMPKNSPPSEAPTSEAAAPDIPIETQTPSAQADDTPAPAAAEKVAAIAETTAAAPDQTAKTDQASAPVDDSTRIAETRIATLGGPPVTIETQTPSKIAPAVIKKSAQARGVVKRRRIAQRARVTQPAPQAPADPFARPFGR